MTNEWLRNKEKLFVIINLRCLVIDVICQSQYLKSQYKMPFLKNSQNCRKVLYTHKCLFIIKCILDSLFHFNSCLQWLKIIFAKFPIEYPKQYENKLSKSSWISFSFFASFGSKLIGQMRMRGQVGVGGLTSVLVIVSRFFFFGKFSSYFLFF